MEFIGKKRGNNNNIKSKSFYNIENKRQNKTKKKLDNENQKIIFDIIENKNNDINKNNNLNNLIYNFNNLNFSCFFNSNNEKILFLSKKLNSAKVLNSSFDQYNFFCAYNSFMNNRPYNEDKILISCLKNNNNRIHLFSIFDGHGGDKCSKYLMNNFDKILFSQKNLITQSPKALKNTYLFLENKFKEINKPKNLLVSIEKSGSCALSLLNIEKTIYCANVGDSRALYSENGSKEVYQISYEHKPQNEKKRIKEAGASICCSSNSLVSIWRLFPGGIAVRNIYNFI